MTNAQCRAARGLLNWTQAELARRLSISVVSVRAVCGVHAPLIFQLQRSEADPRRSNELTEEYLTSSL
ncbi:hypothetical protein F9K97_11050 [Brucella anthropi]|uniref:HTH cro/C1-type domain-containing protein n=2 Tax=Brucella TaxID=234 RepID=A0AB34DHG4_9HYPH|nr:hypothetical protein F9L03_22040 [Brucella lupini]KAB2734640.1 hypothetical protein F9K90_15275 [Brucella anthropi]KAB2741457.1 hypothetical protein F9K89_04760 [Brucella anthropi]KAB2749688.1 hypothetical protein F9K95_16595 [Brucella anthropi]KAB2765658.1 hypothetical protein F9L04_18920 [Brucella anthropi]